MKYYYVLINLLFCVYNCFSATAQSSQSSKLLQKDSFAIVTEINAYLEKYGEEMRTHDRAAIVRRYDSSGYYRMGNGNKRFYSFDQIKTRYLNTWTGPKSFEWRDMSIVVLSPEIVAVTALFNLGDTLGVLTFSYSGLLVKRAEGWRIRLEDESVAQISLSTKTISGNQQSGLWKYLLTARAGTSITAHKHSADMSIVVKSGRKYILMGDLENAKVQRYDAGSSFVIPAGTWHMEWWEEETIEEIEIMAPYKTERATPVTPRKGK